MQYFPTRNIHVLSSKRVNMAFCPLDYRYGCQEFKEIWSELGRHQRQLEVERALVWAHKEMGKVSAEDYAKVAEIAVPSVVTKERVSEIEAETRHDIMALTKAMAEAAGEAGWCIHLGATSMDVEDNADAIRLKEAMDLTIQNLDKVLLALAGTINKYADLPFVAGVAPGSCICS